MGIQVGRNPGRGAGHGKSAGPQPITRHPLFAVLVALWFGALFGLGSLAVDIGLIEALVLKLRVDQILAAAAPPLGMKARILIALAMAVTGALAGLWLGRRLRDSGKAKTADGAAASGLTASLKQVVSREEPTPAGRRRALSAGDGRVDAWPGDLVPLPGERPQVLSVSDYDFISPTPLDLDHFATGEAARVFRPGIDAPVIAAQAPAAQALEPEARPEAAPETPGAGGMTHLDLVNQLAKAMKARRERLAAAAAASAFPPPAFEPAAFGPVGTASHEPAPAVQVPLPRLGQAPAPEAPVAVQVAREVGDESAEDGFEAATDEALDGGYSSLLDLSRPAQPRQSFIPIEGAETDTAASEPEPVAILPGQAPRPFDAPAPASIPAALADREETARALRTALATLQRISGAA